ncbi:hypothetical protein F5Y01DRAFT_311150 [Xylaria sp. FL0043]|nr:hypothetical protein F5Y01DRAFT_311150 [Xylaria sp. FL0043]
MAQHEHRALFLDTRDNNSNENDLRLDKSVIDLALSTRGGSFKDLTSLLQSIHSGLPRDTDNFPIPSQARPSRTISASTGIYKALSPRAAALMYGILPPDRTEPWQWNNVIAPRITNILLRMAKRSRPSGFEISAYLHMLLLDFIEGQRSTSVATEKLFGHFLTDGALPDTEWDKSVIAKKPRFLILGRGEESVVGYHWYTIIVDINIRKAYCFDSKADQNSKESHIAAFDCLRKQWTARMLQIPAPERLIELPSFICRDDYSSGFLCLYHLLLLFRRPFALGKLEHGNITVPQEYPDRIIPPAKNYVGIKVKHFKDVKNKNLRPGAYPLRDIYKPTRFSDEVIYREANHNFCSSERNRPRTTLSDDAYHSPTTVLQDNVNQDYLPLSEYPDVSSQKFTQMSHESEEPTAQHRSLLHSASHTAQEAYCHLQDFNRGASAVRLQAEVNREDLQEPKVKQTVRIRLTLAWVELGVGATKTQR